MCRQKYTNTHTRPRACTCSCEGIHISSIIVVVNKIYEINEISVANNNYRYSWWNEGNSLAPIVPIDRSETRIDELKIFISIGNTIVYHRCRHRRQKLENIISLFICAHLFFKSKNRFQTSVPPVPMYTGLVFQKRYHHFYTSVFFSLDLTMMMVL